MADHERNDHDSKLQDTGELPSSLHSEEITLAMPQPLASAVINAAKTANKVLSH